MSMYRCEICEGIHDSDEGCAEYGECGLICLDCECEVQHEQT